VHDQADIAGIPVIAGEDVCKNDWVVWEGGKIEKHKTSTPDGASQMIDQRCKAENGRGRERGMRDVVREQLNRGNGRGCGGRRSCDGQNRDITIE